MIVLCGHNSGREMHEYVTARPYLGQLLSPRWWKRAFGVYACDNDVFGHREDAGWWKREGEAAWLKMLDKIPADKLPLFCVLPDVVADWPRTLARAYRYREELVCRNLPVAVALQDGCVFEEAFGLSPQFVFVGGTTAWKWANVESITDWFHWRDVRVHLARASGPLRIRECLRVGVDSCDGTGWARAARQEMPKLFRELDQCTLTI